jgi:tetratricopeptide (TPR) repeat protein
MKVVHNSTRELRTANEWLEKARDFENSDELDDAAAAYEKVVQITPLNEIAYNRLMIIYRKTKQYKKELTIIKKGLRAFSEQHKGNTRVRGTKINNLSKALLKATGLSDKKGRPLYEPEPIGRWNTRKKVVENKVSK